MRAAECTSGAVRALPHATASQGARERKRLYEGYLAEVTADAVGELQLEPGDSSRSVQQALPYAAQRLAIKIEIWRVDEWIYFRRILEGGPDSNLGVGRYDLDLFGAEDRDS
jgi:hypothetical protein